MANPGFEIFLYDAHLRMAAIEKAALNAVGMTRVDHGLWPWKQDSFPYFVHRIARQALIEDLSTERTFCDEYEITSRCVVGHYTGGGLQGNVIQGWSLIPVLLQAYRTSDNLTSEAYPEYPQYMSGLDITPSSEPGIVAFQNSGLGVTQLGFEISVVFQVYTSIEMSLEEFWT